VAQGSVEQLAVTGAEPGTDARLRDAGDTVVATARTDATGALLFRDVAPGSGYVVETDGARTAPVTVTSTADVPPTSMYADQRVGDGFGYVRARDGTLLSVNVTLPGPIELGPYPTVVEYSGYDPSNPGGRPPAATIAGLFGYATVGVNLRGTGCSGGAWDYFEPLQSLDGYDVIETIAAQPWVAHGRVGMVGISYSGITQLFVGATRPPHLAAITPLSVIDDTFDTLTPGAIFNNGFGLEWARERQADARPGASAWVRERIDGGDATCAANQALRLQTPDVLDQIETYRFRDAPGSDAIAPETFVDRIDVPVFIAGTWQDEETGAHFAQMLDRFAPDVPLKATVGNGVHADGLAPEVVVRWLEFLDFYVERAVPTVPITARLLAGTVLRRYFPPSFEFPADRFDPDGDFASQLAAYEAEPRVRVRFEVGAEADGDPVAAFERTADAWPLPGTVATTWWMDSARTLADDRPRRHDPDRYRYDPAAFPRVMGSTDAGNGPIPAPDLVWAPLPDGRALTYTTDPLADDTAIVGEGSVDLWLRSSAPDVDVEVTISEIRPDGQETYVQSGWLRAGSRALDPERSTELVPVPTYAEADVAELPRGEWSLVRVPVYPFGHVFRSGSRVRVTVQPPGGNRPSWAFDALTYDRRVVNRIGVGGARASKVVLPVVEGVEVPTALPECGSLRGQPCRNAVEP
jgi:predicted acyl esterase